MRIWIEFNEVDPPMGSVTSLAAQLPFSGWLGLVGAVEHVLLCNRDCREKEEQA